MSSEKLSIVIEVDAKTGRAEIKEVERALDRVSKSAERTESRLKRLDDAFAEVGKRGAIAASAVAGAFGLLAKQVYDTGTEFARIRTKLDVAGEGMGFVSDLAQRLGMDLVQTADAYASLAVAAKGTALEGENARRIFEAVAVASRAMGLSAEQTEGALVAIEQMISKGKVSAEELRGQLGERLPGAFQLAAQAMGMTTAELDKALATGSVMAEDLLPKLADALMQRFAPAAERAAQAPAAAMARLHAAWQAFWGTVADDGAYRAIGALASEITRTLRENEGAVKGLAKALAEDLRLGLEIAVNAGTIAGKALIGLREVARAVATGIHEVLGVLAGLMEQFLRGWQAQFEFLSRLPGRVGAMFKDFADRAREAADTVARFGEAQAAAAIDGEQKLVPSLEQAAQRMQRLDEIGARMVARLHEAGRAMQETRPEAPMPDGTPAVRAAQATTNAIADEYRRRAEIVRGITEAMMQDEEALVLAREEQQLARLEAERQRAIEQAQQKIQDQQQLREALLQINAYYDELEVQLGVQTAQRLEEIERRKHEQILRIEKQARDARLSLAAGAMGALSQLLAQGGRKAFEASKALAVAETVISTYAAAQKAYESQLAIPTPDAPARAAAAAAIAVAQGIARVQAIMRQQYGRAASASAAVGGGGAPATPGGMATRAGYGMPQPIGAQQQAAQPVQINLQVQALHPDALSPDVLQRIADTLAPALHDTLSRGGQAVGVMA